MRRYCYLLLAGFIFFYSCNTSSSSDDAAEDGSQLNKDNYIVLLDLGDRIMGNNEVQVPKDIEVVKSIYSIFTSNLTTKDTTKHYYGITDKLKLLSAPNWVYANLDLGAEKPGNRASVPAKMEETLNFILPDIYRGVITGSTGASYSGAAIWNYFDEHLVNDLDKNGQNTLFILTDGYMGVNKTTARPAEKNRYASCTQIINALKDYPDWEDQFNKGDYGLLPISKKLPGKLQVIVLQLNPKPGWSGEDSLLTKIWDKWFAEMGVGNYHLLKGDSVQGTKAMLAKLMHAGIDTAAATDALTQIATSDSASTTAAYNAAVPEDKTTATNPGNKQAESNNAPKTGLPVTTKENAITPIAPASEPAPGKIIPVASRRKTGTEVLPPDESDARILNVKKSDKSGAKKTDPKNEDDILQDDGAANGFNTGIKKDVKKKKQ